MSGAGFARPGPSVLPPMIVAKRDVRPSSSNRRRGEILALVGSDGEVDAARRKCVHHRLAAGEQRGWRATLSA
jgi:hypothetical protein